MPPLFALMTYLMFVLVGGALLAPWLLAAAEWSAQTWPSLLKLGGHPFHRYVDRALLLLAVVGVYPFAKALGVRKLEHLGLNSSAGQWSRLWCGLAIGFGSLALLALVEVMAGARRLDLAHTGGEIAFKLAEATASAVVVSFLEELLFRGTIFGALRRAHHWTTALVISSAIYALVHFFQRPAEPGVVNWWSGLSTLLQMLAGFGQIQMLIPGFVSLFVVGMILGLAYQRTGNLWLSMGLHAGWVFWLRCYGVFTELEPGAGTTFWGTQRMIDGWVALFLLLPLFALMWFVLSRRNENDEARA